MVTEKTIPEAYLPTTWAYGVPLTAHGLNAIEDAVEKNRDEIIDLCILANEIIADNNESKLEIDALKAAPNIRIVSTLPVSPVNGDMYYLTTNNKLHIRVAGAWKSVTLA